MEAKLAGIVVGFLCIAVSRGCVYDDCVAPKPGTTDCSLYQTYYECLNSKLQDAACQRDLTFETKLNSAKSEMEACSHNQMDQQSTSTESAFNSGGQCSYATTCTKPSEAENCDQNKAYMNCLLEHEKNCMENVYYKRDKDACTAILNNCGTSGTGQCTYAASCTKPEVAKDCEQNRAYMSCLEKHVTYCMQDQNYMTDKSTCKAIVDSCGAVDQQSTSTESVLNSGGQCTYATSCAKPREAQDCEQNRAYMSCLEKHETYCLKDQSYLTEKSSCKKIVDSCGAVDQQSTSTESVLNSGGQCTYATSCAKPREAQDCEQNRAYMSCLEKHETYCLKDQSYLTEKSSCKKIVDSCGAVDQQSTSTESVPNSGGQCTYATSCAKPREAQDCDQNRVYMSCLVQHETNCLKDQSYMTDKSTCKAIVDSCGTVDSGNGEESTTAAKKDGGNREESTTAATEGESSVKPGGASGGSSGGSGNGGGSGSGNGSGANSLIARLDSLVACLVVAVLYKIRD